MADMNIISMRGPLHLGRRRTVLLGAVLVLLATIASALPAPQAEAVSGRRICVYATGVPAKVYVNPELSYDTLAYTGVNYKKDGACPTGTASNFLYGITEAQPVRKIRCEDWSSTIGAVSYLWSYLSNKPETTADPCTQMVKDQIVHFRVRKSDHVAMVTGEGYVR